jgi:glycine cleavage system H lipoate-binding protein
MRCPLLREAQVKSCQASAFKKMIIRGADDLGHEKCSSLEYVHCPTVKQHREETPALSRCPFLHESLVQYCQAAPVTKYIPYSESALSPCGSDNHEYCELFLALARPGGVPEQESVQGIPVPKNLHYAPNHMWLDVSAEGWCHIGIDAFLGSVIGSVERLTFVTVKGLERPAVALTVRDVDLHLAFPRQIHITRLNTHLRANPGRVISDPYGLGWLFEGTAPRATRGNDTDSLIEGLVTGEAALEWMESEVQRASVWVHDHLFHQASQTARLAQDGGLFSRGFATSMSREEMLRLFNDFFSPYASWRKTP